MVKIFRNIRRVLLRQGNTWRYLKYAVGEVVLVVIGILIAIQIDTWRTERKNHISESDYLQSLLQDLKNDSINHILGWQRRYSLKMGGLRLAKDFYYGDYVPTDTVGFMAKVGQGGIGSVGGIRSNDKTFRDLISTGNIRLIQNKNIRNQISNYYTNLEFISFYLGNLRSQYSARINSLRPYNPSSPEYYDMRDTKSFFQFFKNPEMLQLINQEYTYGYTSNREYNNAHKQSLLLRDSIVAYLKSNQ